MLPDHQSLLGVGVYTVREAARLTRIPTRTIGRWARGYSYRQEGGLRHSRPLWQGDIEPIDGEITLSFRDLLEVRFVAYFRDLGVSWKTIRAAADCAAEIIVDSHPFSSRTFKTDGTHILAEVASRTGEATLLNLAQRQYELKPIVDPLLISGIEFSDLDTAPVRWWPLGRDRRVVVDPQRCFGQPICDPESVPTSVLERAFQAEGSVEEVASWHEVSRASVEDALEFEHLLRAA